VSVVLLASSGYALAVLRSALFAAVMALVACRSSDPAPAAQPQRYYERSVAIREQSLAPDHPWTIEVRELCAKVLDARGDKAGAERMRAKIPTKAVPK
jgi:hypothetical protein